MVPIPQARKDPIGKHQTMPPSPDPSLENTVGLTGHAIIIQMNAPVKPPVTNFKLQTTTSLTGQKLSANEFFPPLSTINIK